MDWLEGLDHVRRVVICYISYGFFAYGVLFSIGGLLSDTFAILTFGIGVVFIGLQYVLMSSLGISEEQVNKSLTTDIVTFFIVSIPGLMQMFNQTQNLYNPATWFILGGIVLAYINYFYPQLVNSCGTFPAVFYHY